MRRVRGVDLVLEGGPLLPEFLWGPHAPLLIEEAIPTYFVFRVNI
jgi:hypothetical protein